MVQSGKLLEQQELSKRKIVSPIHQLSNHPMTFPDVLEQLTAKITEK